MTPESTRVGESESGAADRGGDAQQYPRPTRRGVPGVSLAGLGGTLAGGTIYTAAKVGREPPGRPARKTPPP